MLLGIDIGGTKCACILAEAEEDRIRFVKRTEFPTRGSWQSVLQQLCSTAREDMVSAGVSPDRLKGIGVSCGGPLDAREGLILSPPNLPGWDRVPVCEFLRKTFETKVRLMNDADACAMAEWKYGAGKGRSHIIFLTFGTGMGAGLILNGRLYEGASFDAGEIGHIRIEEDGPVGYGKRGSFEGYCSGGGIARLARSYLEERLQKGERTSFQNAVTAKDLAEAAQNGDRDAIAVYRESGEKLGKGLSVLVDLLNPEMIILGGVFMRSSDLLEKSMYEVLTRECLPRSLSAVKIVRSQLGERIGDYGAIVAALEAASASGENRWDSGAI